jgi:AcrR family transcriptional regulator
MSKNAGPRKHDAGKKPANRRPDARTRRTHERLGMALLELMREKPMSDVTVQEVLDRAAVGRSTFYLHFKDKNDLLMSQLEYFLEHMSTMLSARNERSQRVAPVTEMFDHLASQEKLWRGIAESGRLNDFFELAQGYFTRGIERRLKESKRAQKIPPQELHVRAIALSGSLLSLLRWWMDNPSKIPAIEMDTMFHHMVWENAMVGK